MKKLKSLVAIMLIAITASAVAKAEHFSIKTGDGYLLGYNSETISFMLDIKGKDIKP